ncbi:hypothetical protein RRG08_016330 [Elysia crispata]|uniref:Uncharacterized protein n=1 Tax=Elysia crispata TaxID=231223 RepID=A0AAE1AMR2_9GAST|nr:hypothetical protein RRG08_016330 [Elysia crispata]
MSVPVEFSREFENPRVRKIGHPTAASWSSGSSAWLDLKRLGREICERCETDLFRDKQLGCIYINASWQVCIFTFLYRMRGALACNGVDAARHGAFISSFSSSTRSLSGSYHQQSRVRVSHLSDHRVVLSEISSDLNERNAM